MLRDVNVQDAPTIMIDDEKAIERAEGNSRNSEEVHRGNRFPVIMEKGKPALGSALVKRFVHDRDGVSAAPRRILLRRLPARSQGLLHRPHDRPTNRMM